MGARKKRLRRKLGAAAAGATAVVLAVALGVPAWVAGAGQATPQVVTYTTPVRTATTPQAVLRVMTLNVAHGRGDGRHQVLTRKKTHRAKLDAVAAVLARERPDVAALQEADGPSVWSGRFNHVDHLAEAAKFARSVRGEHVSGMKLSYGTALLSMLPLEGPLSVTFAPSPPTPSKGFVLATIAWPGHPTLEVDVVSVHLDFARKKVRRRQVADLIGRLEGRGRPLILMGDLNCQWADEDSPLRTLAEKLELRAYKPEAEDMQTFPKLKRRLDWVLISRELEFARHEIVPDRVSDHLGVVCDVKVAKKD